MGFASLQVTEQIGDAPYQGPLLFRPPNKRRKWQGLEEKLRGMGWNGTGACRVEDNKR